MGKFCLIMSLCTLLLMFAGTQPAGAKTENQPDENADKTLSPYFFIRSDDPAVDRLPLKSTRAEVKIAGVMADVTIAQVYKNEGRNTLEAVYIFPASTRAAVYALRMTVGERIIEAEIMERQKARQTYEQAKKEGRTASLLEQQRPNVFQMNVANILPGDQIKVELRYTELIEPKENIYEFIFPTVVGPRYANLPAQGAPDTQKWVENPYLHEGEPAPYDFSLSLDLNTGLPLAQLTSPSHEIAVEYSGQTQAHVTLKDDKQAGAKDFVLRYQLAGDRIETGLLLYPGPEENFFLMMMEPPQRVKPESVLPREYIFIVDVSGSMRGFPLKTAKVLMRDIITNLRPSDFMNVLLFAGGSAVLSPDQSLPATEANKAKAVSWIDSQAGGGGTEILPALKRALALPKTEDVSRIMVVVTDGYVSVEPEAFELVRRNLGQSNLFAFGIGGSVNRHLIEGLARVGQGEPFVVLNEAEGPGQAERFRRYIENPVLTGIRAAFEGFEAYDVEPQALPDLFASRPIILIGKYRGRPAGRIVVTGKTSQGAFKKVVEVSKAGPSPENSALQRLWARHRIMRLADLNNLEEQDERIKEVTALGLKYSLMTPYTSFVAVDTIKRADGQLVTVKQPLPLPAGVSDLAVGEQRVKMAGAVTMMRDSSAFKPQAAPVALKEEKKTEVKLNVIQVRGDLNRAEVERVLENQTSLFEQCRLTASGQAQTRPAGEASYRILIQADGTVKEVTLIKSTIHAPRIEACFKKAMERLTFIQSGQGDTEVVIKITC